MSAVFDPETNALYLRFSKKNVVESQEVAPGVVLDFDAEKNVVAIEVLDARGFLASDDVPPLSGSAVRVVAKSGEACPVSGLWLALEIGNRLPISRGEAMPRLEGRDVTWLLALAA